MYGLTWPLVIILCSLINALGTATLWGQVPVTVDNKFNKNITVLCIQIESSAVPANYIVERAILVGKDEADTKPVTPSAGKTLYTFVVLTVGSFVAKDSETISLNDVSALELTIDASGYITPNPTAHKRDGAK